MSGAVAARLRAKYGLDVSNDPDGRTDDTPNEPGGTALTPSSVSGPSAEPWVASPVALPLPGVRPCDYCGGACTRKPRQGRVLCGSTCRSKARRWLAWASVPESPYPGSTLWARSRRTGVDDRPVTVRVRVSAGVEDDLASMEELRAATAEVTRALRDALRDGPVCLVWSVERLRVERG